MRLIQLLHNTDQHVGLVSVLPRVTDEQVRQAHERYCQYHSNHTESSDSDPLDFEEWCKIYEPELGLVRVFVDEVDVDEDLI